MPTLNKEARLAFVVDYDDTQAGLVRKYQLCYYTTDDTIDMHDIKNRRVFLKRCSYPQLTQRDLYIGAMITIYSRKLKVVGYSDDATRQVYAGESERAVIAVSPRNFGMLGQILDSIVAVGLRIKSLNTLNLSQGEAEEFAPKDTGAWAGKTMAVVEVLGSDANQMWRKLDEKMQFGTWSSTEQNSDKYADWFFGAGSARRDRNSATMRDCSVCIIKPHAVDKHGGQIVNDILNEGFQITALKMINIGTRDAVDFLEVYKGVVPEYRALVEQLSAGPSWVMEIRGENPVTAFRELCGPHDPDIAKVLRPKSLRAQFGTTRVLNALHCTDLPEDGELESDFFFNIMRPVSS
eukprot:TRINITY_DN23332_c0_g1_i1.p1 TRINITY_DN23332_c0_g1~~TRINITY_DN23332_c0_g1_i1.p1  ORF type:complete len:350 (+),score=126.27 TRINITY_DN23332_c0_g1_i1:177-1226(+)